MIIESSVLVLCIIPIYAWIVYPLILRRPAGRVTGRASGDSRDPGWEPRIAVLFSAYNEEKHIADRLNNLLQFQCPSERVEIFVGVDCSDDGTADIARGVAAACANIHVHEYGERRGKVAVLKDLVGASRQLTGGADRGGDGGAQEPGDTLGDILVFTDANTMFAPDALQKLVRHFADPEVGGVCGRLVFRVSTAVPEGRYWQWETLLKERESALDSCLGANGAIFAIRRELFWAEIPDNTIVDDFVIGMKVREQGLRMLYEPLAVGEEELPEPGSEWGRRIRIGAGDFQALWFCRRCLLPRFGRFAWMFWSHKVLRWFTPHVLLLLLAGLSFLAVRSQFQLARHVSLCICLGFVFCCLMAVAGGVGRSVTAAWMRLPRMCCHLLTMQAALFLGFIRCCRGNLVGHWTRTPR